MLKKIAVFIAFSAVLLILYSLGRQIFNALQSGKRLDEAVNKLTQLQQENRRLQARLNEVQSVDFIETQLRNKLNLAKPNETVVIIPQNVLTQVLGVKKQAEEIKLPNWQGWLRLFFPN